MISAINNVLLRLSKRAENSGREALIHTFVDVGPLSTLMASTDHQIIYGRRGTGKTHALAYLSSQRYDAGDAIAYVDLRNIGSSGGIYADASRSLSERATCLLVDTLSAVHERLYEFFISNPENPDLSQTGPALDALAVAITEVAVVGTVETEERSQSAHSDFEKSNAGLVASGSGIEAQLGSSSGSRHEDTASTRVKRSGTEQLHINFGSTGAAFRRISELLAPRRLWVLLDEWSSLPVELQPYLADLLRRSMLPVTGITLKIAAIDQRSQFQIRSIAGDYIGIEIGADVAADVNLDDFMVFDNDAERAKEFFKDLVTRHARAVANGSEFDDAVAADSSELIGAAFTQARAFEEFVRASEGVPRDAINILSIAAQRALDGTISVEHIRVAARNWYQRDKDKAVSANSTAHNLLHRIIDKVIGERRARAFLLRSGENHPLIDALYDSRVLHILKRSISTHDQPGVRYDAYKLDYGCYVDLIATQRAPEGLFPGGDDAETGGYVDVPPDDYRSIRRAILDLREIGIGPTDVE
jgi:hypothetical protein